MSDRDDALLVALDIDGTVVAEDGSLSPAVRSSVRSAVERGHRVMLATGRGAASTTPVARALGIEPEYLVCSNGAVTLRRDVGGPDGYRRDLVETFDPTEALTTVAGVLAEAQYAVEDAEGFFRYTERFPHAAVGEASALVGFDELLAVPAARIVVISPDTAIEDFLRVVERMGLQSVSYAVGWTSWLDIAPEGVNKATAMERVRDRLGVPRDRVVAVGDGRNDVELLAWAAESGRGVAMGQAPPEVRAAAGETCRPVADDGLARLLDSLR